MSPIDFSELPADPPGEALEKLAREILAKFGLVPRWSGRGADGGRDQEFVERQEGPVGSRAVRWLVSCKDHAKSGKSVSEAEAGEIADKLLQHKAEGFLLITTTIPGAALKDKLDKLDYANGGHFCTKVWDAHELSMLLVRDEFHDLLKIYLPESYKRVKALGESEWRREQLIAQLPYTEKKQLSKLTYEELLRRASVSGTSIWPHEPDEKENIDLTVHYLIDKGNIEAAAKSAIRIDFDVFMNLLESLFQEYPEKLHTLLVKIIEEAKKSGVVFNAFQFMAERYDFSNKDEELYLASFLGTIRLTYQRIEDYLFARQASACGVTDCTAR